MVLRVLPLSSTAAARRRPSARVNQASSSRASFSPCTSTELTWKLAGPWLMTLSSNGACAGAGLLAWGASLWVEPGVLRLGVKAAVFVPIYLAGRVLVTWDKNIFEILEVKTRKCPPVNTAFWRAKSYRV